MYKVFQQGPGWYLDITHISGIINIIPLTGPPRAIPANFEHVESGSGWACMDTAEAITGGTFRYTTNKNNPPGNWYTNILSTSNLMMQSELKLGTDNTAEHKQRAWICPTTIAVSYIPNTKNVQVYVWDTGKIKLIESTGTSFDFKGI